MFFISSVLLNGATNRSDLVMNLLQTHNIHHWANQAGPMQRPKLLQAAQLAAETTIVMSAPNPSNGHVQPVAKYFIQDLANTSVTVAKLSVLR
jgi:hypothetical protein